MGDILSIKRWNPVEYKLRDRVVATMELKRMNALESASFLRSVYAARQAFMERFPEKGIEPLRDDATPEEMEAQLAKINMQMARNAQARAEFFAAIPDDMIRQTFAKCVRGLKVFALVDDVEVTTTDGLLEIADHEMLLFILNSLDALCTLRSAEGKASASPSTSGSEPGPTSGAPDATSTGSEASTSTSTVTPTLDPSLSIGPLE